MWTDSPDIEIRVNKPGVDIIRISAEKGIGWTLYGFKEEASVQPDEQQDQFNWVIHSLAKFVDETSVWTNLKTGRQVSAWEAMTILTKHDGDDSGITEGQ